VVPLKYGFFDTVSFLFPFFIRSRPLKVLEWKIDAAIDGNTDSELVIVAHSFGTFAVMELLSRPLNIACFSRAVTASAQAVVTGERR
jgi:hypothetical protein